jgi:hypothetical protein
MPCKICNGSTVEHARTLIKNKYQALFVRCEDCGFIFVPEPTWIAEVYAEPINRSDTGYVSRNLWARDKMRYCIETYLNPAGIFLDYAAGYGMFVRLMRDAGYDFRWADMYCENLFSRGFEAPTPLAGPFECVTAFEVFEHLVNPGDEMEIISKITTCLVLSTKLLPEPAPKPEDWWYFGLEHGQHVALYTRKSLDALARRFGFQMATNGDDLHIFSKRAIPQNIFYQPPLPPRWQFWKERKTLPTRPSFTMKDHDLIANEILRKK